MDRRQAAQLEWMRRNYALLTPEQRAIVDAADGRTSPDPNSSTAEVSFGDDAPNVVSDLDASATPMPAEPVLQPGRQRGRADRAVDAATAGGLYSPSENVAAMRVGDKPSLSATMRSANTLASPEAFDAAFNANGYSYPSATAAFARQLVARGVDPAYAQRAAAAAAAEHRAPHTPGVYADEMYATENPRDLYGGYGTSPAGTPTRAPGATPPGYDAWAEAMTNAETGTTRAQRLAAADEAGRRIDRQAAAYNRVTGLTPPDTSVADEEGPYPGAGRPGYDRTYTPDEVLAQRDQAEAERQSQWADERNAAIGAKYGPQARKVAEAADAKGQIDFSAVQSPREKEMNKYREAVERSARFDPDTEKRENARELRGQLERSRSEDRKKFRAQVASAPKSPVDPRMERWKAQAMLAGGQPTGGPRGTKAVTNAWYALGDEGLNDWQRLTMAKALRPDIDGTSPLTVDANSAKNAVRLLNAEMIGAGGLGDVRAMMMQQQSRVAADEMAQREAAKLMGMFKKTLTRQEAERIRRRIEAVHPGMGGVVEGLPIDDDAPVVPGGVATGSVPAV